jgi:hypothetical protein
MRQVAVYTLAVLWCGTTLAGFTATDVFIPALGRVEGFGGSQFDSTVYVTNPNAEPAQIMISFLPSGGTPSPPSFADTIAPAWQRTPSSVKLVTLGISQTVNFFAAKCN